jgi:phage host-nuclease inhibitor protein Gam
VSRTDRRTADRLTGDRRLRDRGAGLLLAIGFVTMIGGITAGLTGMLTSGLQNRITLDNVRNRQYAADAAVESTIAQVRQLDRTTTGSCSSSGGSTTSSLNGSTIRVDWRTACTVVRGADGVVVSQRNAVFNACVDTGAACATDAVIIAAQVNFEQGATGAVTKTYVQSWSVSP